MNKILFMLLLLVSGVATAQQKRVTLQEQSISFKEAFARIEQQTGYSIAYNETLIDVNTKQTLSLRNKPLEKALSKLLKGPASASSGNYLTANLLPLPTACTAQGAGWIITTSRLPKAATNG